MILSEMTAIEAQRTNDAIKAGIVAVRALLLDMRDRKGWMALGYHSFDEYGKAELGYEKSHLHRLANAAEIERSLEVPHGGQIPERQLRPLSSLSDEERRKVWEEATAKAEEEGKRLTAKAIEQAVANLEQAKEDWRQQAISTKRKLDEISQLQITQQVENKRLRDAIATEAKLLANAEAANLKAEMKALEVEKTELKEKLRQERKSRDAEIVQRVDRDLKSHQSEITNKELQLASIERRITVLQQTLRPMEAQAGFIEMHRKALNDASQIINNLELVVTRAFDEDEKDRFNLPQDIADGWGRIAKGMHDGAYLLQRVLNEAANIRAIETEISGEVVQ